MKRILGSWGADGGKVCLVVTTTGAAPMPIAVGTTANDSLPRVVVSQLQGETVEALHDRLNHRLRVLESHRQSVESAMLMVGVELADAGRAGLALAALLSDELAAEGELSLVAQPGASDRVRAELFRLFDAVAGRQRGTGKGVTVRFLAGDNLPEEPRSGVWSSPLAVDSDAEVA